MTAQAASFFGAFDTHAPATTNSYAGIAGIPFAGTAGDAVCIETYFRAEAHSAIHALSRAFWFIAKWAPVLGAITTEFCSTPTESCA